jgi:GntR family transcriptional repressor for pyruvate dehydrogenase complex
MRLFRDQPMPTAEEMERLLELRQVLEETTASLAAVRATEEDLTEMEAALRQMKEDGLGLDETIAADLRFHRAVMRAAHNRYFEIVLDPLTEVFQQQIKLTNSYDTGWELHRSIFQEIRARNPIGARQAVRRLMKQTLSDSRKALKEFSQD